MYRKLLLILALGAGLTSLPQQATAAVIYSNLNSFKVANSIGVVYAVEGSPYIDSLGLSANSIRLDTNGNGVNFANYSSYEDPDFGTVTNLARLVVTNKNFLEMTSTLLSDGATVDANSILAGINKIYPSHSATEQFIGTSAKIGTDFYYGWIGFTLNSSGVFTLKEAAFNSIANQGITIQSVPEPSALMFGALAVTGLFARRRRAA